MKCSEWNLQEINSKNVAEGTGLDREETDWLQQAGDVRGTGKGLKGKSFKYGFKK